MTMTTTNSRSLPWRDCPRYFNAVHVSPLAMSKMMAHAAAAAPREIMGLLLGSYDTDTLLAIGVGSERAFHVCDVLPLPVEGTETRVNAAEDANEYMVEYLDNCRRIPQAAAVAAAAAPAAAAAAAVVVVGWYHSHPGYGCWLSGVDVVTQQLHQKHQDPFVAIVIDPTRSARAAGAAPRCARSGSFECGDAGEIEIGAFRTLPESKSSTSSSTTTSTTTTSNLLKLKLTGDPAARSGADLGMAVSKSRVFSQDMGAYAETYYALDVHVRSVDDSALAVDSLILESLTGNLSDLMAPSDTLLIDRKTSTMELDLATQEIEQACSGAKKVLRNFTAQIRRQQRRPHSSSETLSTECEFEPIYADHMGATTEMIVGDNILNMYTSSGKVSTVASCAAHDALVQMLRYSLFTPSSQVGEGEKQEM